MRIKGVLAPIVIAALVSCTAEPGPVSASAKASPGKYPPLTVTATATPLPAKEVSLRIRAGDGDGWVRIEAVHWGDGDSHVPTRPTPSCAPVSKYQRPSPSTLNEELRHTYARDDTYSIRLLVRSGDDLCPRPADLELETAELVLKVRVAD